MKHKAVILLLVIVGLAACMMTTVVTTYQTKNDLVLKDSWKTFLAANPAPKVVLRVPDSPKDITQQEMMSYNSLYSFIEKRLLEANYTVRDRAMLTEVLRRASGELNYADIGKKIDTDVIVEIVNVKLGTWMQGTASTEYRSGANYAARADAIVKRAAPTVTKGQEGPSPADVFGAILEGRIVMVSTGDIVGMFTLKEIHPHPDQWQLTDEHGRPSYDAQGRPMRISSENMNDADVEYLRTNITQKLIDFLKGQNVADSSVTTNIVM